MFVPPLFLETNNLPRPGRANSIPFPPAVGATLIVPVLFPDGIVMAQAIPEARTRFFPDEGHISIIVNRYEELLSTLLC